MKKMQNNLDTRPPFGLAIGMLTACAMTLISVLCGNEPETVLFRAGVGGSMTGLLAAGLVSVLRSILDEDEEL